jgi:uncharacterized protein (DUF849 family)
VRIKACLNGDRAAGRHPALPLTPAQLAADARACAEAGVFAVHVHPRGADGVESLHAPAIGDAVRAIRAAAPGIAVGVSTGAWILPDVDARLAAIASWDAAALPDFASVNVHEDGADAVAAALAAHGVGLEAGVWTVEAAERFAAAPWREACVRVLIEIMGGGADEAVAAADAIVAALDRAGWRGPRLLHGEGEPVWPVARHAARLGYELRIGLEDTLTGPDGRPVAGNAELVRLARAHAGGPDGPSDRD